MFVFPKEESQTVKFKSQWSPNIKKTIVAFANTTGGDIYVGIDDNGEIVGCEAPGKIQKRVISMARDNISPSVLPLLQFVTHRTGGQSVLQIHVDRGTQRPYCFDTRDPSSIYVRAGNVSLPACVEEITAMVAESNPVPWEERYSLNQELSFDIFNEYCEQKGVILSPRNNMSFGLWSPSMEGYTNLAQICSDQCPFQIVCVEYGNNDKTAVIQIRRFEGSILRQFEQCLEFLKSILLAGMTKGAGNGLERQNHYSVPEVVLREALVNLIAHRDFSRTAPCTIHVTPAKVEFFSIGGLAELFPEDVYSGLCTNCRNKKLAALLVRLGLMENAGTGFNLIFSAYKDYPQESLIIIRSNSFLLRLPRRRPLLRSHLDTDSTLLLDFICAQKEVSRKEIQDFLGVTQTTANLRIKTLIEGGSLEKIGAGPSTRYRVSAPIE